MNQKLAIAVFLGFISFVEAVEISKLKSEIAREARRKTMDIPPYWDGVYSKTWRYTHPYWRAANEPEYLADQPRAYVAEPLKQSLSHRYHSFAQDDNKLDGTAWKTADFYHYNEKEYREDSPTGYNEAVEYTGKAMTPEQVETLRQNELKVNLQNGLKSAEINGHTNNLIQR